MSFTATELRGTSIAGRDAGASTANWGLLGPFSCPKSMPIGPAALKVITATFLLLRQQIFRTLHGGSIMGKDKAASSLTGHNEMRTSSALDRASNRGWFPWSSNPRPRTSFLTTPPDGGGMVQQNSNSRRGIKLAKEFSNKGSLLEAGIAIATEPRAAGVCLL